MLFPRHLPLACVSICFQPVFLLIWPIMIRHLPDAVKNKPTKNKTKAKQMARDAKDIPDKKRRRKGSGKPKGKIKYREIKWVLGNGFHGRAWTCSPSLQIGIWASILWKHHRAPQTWNAKDEPHPGEQNHPPDHNYMNLFGLLEKPLFSCGLGLA